MARGSARADRPVRRIVMVLRVVALIVALMMLAWAAGGRFASPIGL